MSENDYSDLPKRRSDAKACGSPVYFTGKPCKQGHVAPRRVHNGECKACQKKSDEKHREINGERRRKSFRDWYKANREEQLVRMRQWQQTNRDYFNNYENEKRQNDPQYRMAKALRDRIYKAVSRGDKSEATLELLGCSIEEFVRYIEAQFSEGMTWKNYGDWHIDHIRPCISYDLSDPEQQKDCFHYSNLQPLWEFDNKSKGGRWRDEGET